MARHVATTPPTTQLPLTAPQGKHSTASLVFAQGVAPLLPASFINGAYALTK